MPTTPTKQDGAAERLNKLHADVMNLTRHDAAELVTAASSALLSEVAALRKALEEAGKDLDRLNWLQSQWRDGVHVEVCAKGNGTDWHGMDRWATVFAGNQAFGGFGLREAIDAARSALEGGSK